MPPHCCLSSPQINENPVIGLGQFHYQILGLLISNKSKNAMTLWEYHAYIIYSSNVKGVRENGYIIDVDRTQRECQASIVLSGTIPITILVLCWIPS